MVDVHPVIDWLIRGAIASPMEALAGTCDGLVKAGVPMERGEAFVRTLHPNIAGRSFLWRPGKPIEVTERTFAWLQSPEFAASPEAEVCRTSKVVERMPAALAAEGYTGYSAVPLEFITKQTHVISYATKAPGGFSPDHHAAVRAVTPAVARIGEIFALYRTATNVLSTYVGRNAGARVMSGQIVLGDTDTLRAAIWFSDLRGFTQLTASAEPPNVIRALNELFGCQIPAIEKHGGEVLKFMGDGLFAIFPFGVTSPCDAALDAAFAARRALDQLNARRESPLEFGLALHVGDVSYGNIGGESRLDFTCIGPAVNVAARIEAVASKLSRPIVMSEEFAKLLTKPVTPLGSFELKGVTGARELFAPA